MMMKYNTKRGRNKDKTRKSEKKKSCRSELLHELQRDCTKQQRPRGRSEYIKPRVEKPKTTNTVTGLTAGHGLAAAGPSGIFPCVSPKLEKQNLFESCQMYCSAIKRERERDGGGREEREREIERERDLERMIER